MKRAAARAATSTTATATAIQRILVVREPETGGVAAASRS
jgi:hypothetical protein